MFSASDNRRNGLLHTARRRLMPKPVRGVEGIEGNRISSRERLSVEVFEPGRGNSK
jgi:hypothetical protein